MVKKTISFVIKPTNRSAESITHKERRIDMNDDDNFLYCWWRRNMRMRGGEKPKIAYILCSTSFYLPSIGDSLQKGCLI